MAAVARYNPTEILRRLRSGQPAKDEANWDAKPVLLPSSSQDQISNTSQILAERQQEAVDEAVREAIDNERRKTADRMDDLAHQVETLQQQLDLAKGENAQLKQRLNTLERSQNSDDRKINNIENEYRTRLAELQRENDQVYREYGVLEQRTATLQDENRQLCEQLEKHVQCSVVITTQELQIRHFQKLLKESEQARLLLEKSLDTESKRRKELQKESANNRSTTRASQNSMMMTESRPAFVARVASQSHHRAAAPASSMASFPSTLSGTTAPIHVSIDLSNIPEISGASQQQQGSTVYDTNRADYDRSRRRLPEPPTPQ